MTQTVEILDTRRVSHNRTIGAVSTAHFISHYYIVLLAPLLPFVRDDFGVTYTQIGIALAAFNMVTALLQAPAGFLVDRIGARVLLITGLLISAGAFVIAGLVHSFWIFVAMFALAGLGNTVYHPADYALLSQRIPTERIGQAFSIHTFAGMLGSAVAPPTLLIMQNMWGWRGAFIGAGALGIGAAIFLLAINDRQETILSSEQSAKSTMETNAASWRILLSGPILLSLVFFVLLAMISGGIYNYSVVALGALYATPVAIANTALTGNLLLTAIGVLAGGALVGRTSRHATVATAGLFALTLFILLVAKFDLPDLTLVLALSAAGFFAGVIMPSRDMIVRAATPPGSFGKVFGFVTTGFNIGGIISPLVFGAIMDHGSPRLVFFTVAACAFLAILTVITRSARTA